MLDDLWEGIRFLTPGDDLSKTNHADAEHLVRKIGRLKAVLEELQYLIRDHTTIQTKKIDLICQGPRFSVTVKSTDLILDSAMTAVAGWLGGRLIIYLFLRSSATTIAGVMMLAAQQHAAGNVAWGTTFRSVARGMAANTASIALTLTRLLNVLTAAYVVYKAYSVGETLRKEEAELKKEKTNFESDLKTVSGDADQIAKSLDTMLMEISSPDADKKPVLISAGQGKEETKVFVVSLASLMAELVKAAGDLSISESSFNERLTQFSTKRKELVSIAVTLLDASIAKAAIADNDLQKVYGLLCAGVSIDTVKAIYHSIPDVIFNAIATPEVLSKKWPEIAVVISETGKISITERNLSKLRYQKSWGTGGLGGESFQDDINGRITGIEVNSGDVIDGFAAYYNGTRGPWHGGTKGTKQIVKFDDDEFIASVGVSKGKSWKMTVVNGLKIKTNKRTFIFGNGKELEERDIVVAGFYGRSGDFIDEIGFLTISI